VTKGDSQETIPVVLVHGLCGFHRLFQRRRPTREYFPGIRRCLEQQGYRVLMPQLSPTAGIATRAAELREFIRREVGQHPVHLIGHSLGGLDARYLISRLGMERQVRSLVTVGTPHWGSSFADWAVTRLARLFRPLLQALGISDEAIFDLTTERCRRLNELVPDAPTVRYSSVAGRCDSRWLGQEWRFSSEIVQEFEGPNDGVVSLTSARWGERQLIWTGDHLNLVNWPNRFMCRAGTWSDRGPSYVRLLAELNEGWRRSPGTTAFTEPCLEPLRLAPLRN